MISAFLESVIFAGEDLTTVNNIKLIYKCMYYNEDEHIYQIIYSISSQAMLKISIFTLEFGATKNV